MIFSNPYLLAVVSLLALFGIPLGATGVLPIGVALSEKEILDRLLKSWPAIPASLAYELITKYGLPSEVSTSRLAWYSVGPWKRMVVCCEPASQGKPLAYNEYLEQVIDIDIPLEKVVELSSFTPHLVMDRARGELLVRCYNEYANFLTLNLARKILKEDLSAEQARRIYADNIRAYMRGEVPDMMAQLVSLETNSVSVKNADVRGTEDQRV